MPRGRACAWRSVPTCARGDNSPAACSVGWVYHPRETVVRVGPPALQTQRRRRLTQRSRTKLAMPTHADSTHPTIQPLRYTTPPGTLWRIVRGAQRLHTFANTARLLKTDRYSSLDLSYFVPTNPYRNVREVQCQSLDLPSITAADTHMTHKGIQRSLKPLK